MSELYLGLVIGFVIGFIVAVFGIGLSSFIYNKEENTCDDIIDVMCRPECQCYRCNNTCYRCEGCIDNNYTSDCDKFVLKEKKTLLES